MPRQQPLKVFVNPYCAELDPEGRPHGHVRYEPPKGARRGGLNIVPPLLGCHLLATPVESGEDGAPADEGLKLHQVLKHAALSQADWDHVFEYDTEPTTIPYTAYYRDLLIRHGHHGPALLPADEASYAIVHGTKAGFRDPRARLHQYAVERGAIPRLKPTTAVQTAHAVAETLAGKAPERDHEAEWRAFVGEKVLEARKAHEDEQAALRRKFHPTAEERAEDEAAAALKRAQAEEAAKAAEAAKQVSDVAAHAAYAEQPIVFRDVHVDDPDEAVEVARKKIAEERASAAAPASPITPEKE